MTQRNIESNKCLSSKEMKTRWKQHDEWCKKHPVLACVQELQYLPDRIYNFIRWKYLNFIAFFQRGWRGWANIDTWSWYGYAAKINRDALRYLKEIKHGIPNSIIENGETFEISEKRWNETLDKIIQAFDYIVKDQEGVFLRYCPTFTKKWREKYQKDFNCHVMSKEEDDVINEGLQLYIKHFFGLWD